MKFEYVSYDAFKKDMLKNGWGDKPIRTAYENIKLPERKTVYSAGYDISTPIGFTMKPNGRVIIPTGIKAKFGEDEARSFHLALYIRSSVGINRGVVMANQTGVIDADYYGNEDNEGDMLIALYNTTDHEVRFEAGERILQGVFMIHGLVVGDTATAIRKGGVGSTDK